MNQFEYKKRYDPDLGMYVKKHIHSGEIHGGALTDIFKSLFGKTMKEAAKTASKKALQTAATKTGEFAGKKAGDKIIQLLSKKNKTQPNVNQMNQMSKPLSQYEINERVNRIISGGGIRKNMQSNIIMFRNSKYGQRYEDVVFELETPLNTTVANNAHQKKDGYRFVADNTGEVTPFDRYNSRIVVDFKVSKLADGGCIAAEDHNGIVNGSHSLINNFKVNLNGKKVYDLNDPNHCVNIKNLLECSPIYAETTATNEFFYLDANRHAEERTANANYNKGFAARKTLLGTSSTVSVDISLDRYSFFNALQNELLPNTRLELNLEIESDDNLIWQAADNCRVIITKMQLYVPRITFNSEGQSLYASKFITNKKWTYLREEVLRSNSSSQRTGHFNITSGSNKQTKAYICFHHQ